jgi:hypothetical protein
MGFRDKENESPLTRIISQIDGGPIREDLTSQRVSPHDVMYHRFNRMRHMQEKQLSPYRDVDEELSEGYQPLRKRASLEDRVSGTLLESDDKQGGDFLAVPLGNSQPARKRLPQSLQEMRSQVLSEEFVDPSAEIEREMRLEEELERKRQERRQQRRNPQSDSLNESFDDLRKNRQRRKPLDLDMPIANREGMRVSETVTESPKPRPVRQPQPQPRPKKITEKVSDFGETLVSNSDLTGFLRNLGSKVNVKSVEEPERVPTREEVFQEEQALRNRLFTDGVKPVPVSKPRRRVESQQPLPTSPIKESDDTARSTVEETFKKINMTLAENGPQGIRLFEDVLYDYVSMAYVAQNGIEITSDDDTIEDV